VYVVIPPADVPFPLNRDCVEVHVLVICNPSCSQGNFGNGPGAGAAPMVKARRMVAAVQVANFFMDQISKCETTSSPIPGRSARSKCILNRRARGARGENAGLATDGAQMNADEFNFQFQIWNSFYLCKSVPNPWLNCISPLLLRVGRLHRRKLAKKVSKILKCLTTPPGGV
jgi:hypothetical protein